MKVPAKLKLQIEIFTAVCCHGTSHVPLVLAGDIDWLPPVKGRVKELKHLYNRLLGLSHVQNHCAK